MQVNDGKPRLISHSVTATKNLKARALVSLFLEITRFVY